MRYEKRSKAMSYQHNLGTNPRHSFFKKRYPLFANRVIPIPLLQTEKRGILLFPKGLPMVRTGAPDSREDEGSYLFV